MPLYNVAGLDCIIVGEQENAFNERIRDDQWIPRAATEQFCNMVAKLP